MAENKNSFVFYLDWIHIFRKLSNERKVYLMEHLFDYVTDKNPTPKDEFIDLAFEPIKHTLKRDLKKYESIVNRNRENGKNGGRPTKEPKKPSGLIGNPKNPSEPKKADSDNVNDNDSGIVNEILLKKEPKQKFMFNQSLLELVKDEQLVNDYMELRRLKKAPLTKTAFDGLVKECETNKFPLEKAIRICIERNWQGFKYEWLKPEEKSTIKISNKPVFANPVL